MFDKNFNENCGADFLIEKNTDNEFVTFLWFFTYFSLLLFFLGLFLVYKKCTDIKTENLNPQFLQIENSTLSK